MSHTIKKYNPGFLTEEELIASFCVRESEYELILESLLTWPEHSGIHTLVIGPRGSGKTHLLLRTVAEIHREPALESILPVLFAEESYEISTCGEFWLEALERLAEQTSAAEREKLHLSHREIQTTQDDKTLALRSLGALLDFADAHNQRLLLVVENLNMLFADMADPAAAWQLRQTLQTEPRILLLGSATSRFAEIDDHDRALYDLFRVIVLHPLDTEDCKELWQAVCQQEATKRAIRPLEILTGGNPRLLTIIAHFGSGRSFRELLGNLVDLVDDHTEYFKSHLETLPHRERRVYLALARLWKPATTKEVAELARLDTNKCSALLKRLVGRGVVEETGGTPRRHQYYLTERLYNIYYLMRRSRGPDRIVQALIEFMVCLYAPLEMGDILEEIASSSHDWKLLPPNVAGQMAQALLDKARILEEGGLDDEALLYYDQISHRLPLDEAGVSQWQIAYALMRQAQLLLRQEQTTHCIAVCEEFDRRCGGNFELLLLGPEVFISFIKGFALYKQHKISHALEALEPVLSLLHAYQLPEKDALQAMVFHARGLFFLEAKQFPEAIQTFDQVLESRDQTEDTHVVHFVIHAMVWKAIALFEADQYVPEEDFSLLLQYLAKHSKDGPPRGFISMMCRFIVNVSPERTLELILDSPAVPLLLPLVTALQTMLGQEPRVPREVEEVALDVRDSLEHPVSLFGEETSVSEHIQ